MLLLKTWRCPCAPMHVGLHNLPARPNLQLQVWDSICQGRIHAGPYPAYLMLPFHDMLLS